METEGAPSGWMGGMGMGGMGMANIFEGGQHRLGSWDLGKMPSIPSMPGNLSIPGMPPMMPGLGAAVDAEAAAAKKAAEEEAVAEKAAEKAALEARLVQPYLRVAACLMLLACNVMRQEEPRSSLLLPDCSAVTLVRRQVNPERWRLRESMAHDNKLTHVHTYTLVGVDRAICEDPAGEHRDTAKSRANTASRLLHANPRTLLVYVSKTSSRRRRRRIRSPINRRNSARTVRGRGS